MSATPKQIKRLKSILKLEKSLKEVIANDICANTGVKHSPLSIMLKRLERDEYIIRDVVPRGARRWIKLTEKGLRECM